MPKYIQIGFPENDQKFSIWVQESEAESLLNFLVDKGLPSKLTGVASVEIEPPNSITIDNEIAQLKTYLENDAWLEKLNNIETQPSAIEDLYAIVFNQLDALTLAITDEKRNIHDAIKMSCKLSNSDENKELKYISHPTGDTLASTLALAKEIRADVRAFIPMGSTSPELALARRELLRRKEGVQPSLNDLAMMSLIAESNARLKAMRAEKDIKEYKTAREEAIRKHRAANCQERAEQALDFLELRELGIPGELCGIKTRKDCTPETKGLHMGDHVFLVINRVHPSDDNDPATWGPLAVICDPWSDNEEFGVYPASDYKKYMKNFYTDPVNGNSTEPLDIGPDGCHDLVMQSAMKSSPANNSSALILQHISPTAPLITHTEVKHQNKKKDALISDISNKITLLSKESEQTSQVTQKSMVLAVTKRILNEQSPNIDNLIEIIRNNPHCFDKRGGTMSKTLKLIDRTIAIIVPNEKERYQKEIRKIVKNELIREKQPNTSTPSSVAPKS